MSLAKLPSACVFTGFLRRNCARTVLAATSWALISSAAQASTITWSGAASGTWSATGNWTGGVAPTSSDIAEFDTTFTNQPTVATATGAGAIWATTGLGQNVTIGGSLALTLAGNLTVNGNANTAILLDDSGNHSLTITAPLTLGNSTSFMVNNTGTLSINTGALTLGSNTLTLAGTNAAGTIAIGSVISGTGGVKVNTSGTVSLSANDSFTGGIQVQAGTVLTSTNLGNASGTVTLGASSGSSNATIISSLNGNLASPLIVSGGTTGTLTIEGQTNNTTFTGSLTLNNNLTVDNLTSGHVTTFSGVTTETSTPVTITKGGGAGSVSFTGTLVPGAGGLTFANSGSTSTGVLSIGSVWTSSGSITLDANSAASISMSTVLTNSNAQTLTNAGTGTGSVTVTGLAGSSLTLVQNSATSEMYYAPSNASTFAAIKVQTGTLQLGFNLSGSSTPITISSPGTLATTGVTVTDTITNSGNILALGASNLDGTINGTGNLTVNTGSLNVTLGTTGESTINTYTGTTTIQSGSLTPYYVGSIGANTGSITNGGNTITIASTTGTFLATGDVMYANQYFASSGTITAISTTGSLTTITLNTTANTGTATSATSVAANFTLPDDSLGAQSSTLILNGGTLWMPLSASEVTTRLFELGPNGGDVDNSNGGSTSSVWFTNTGAITYTTSNVTETFTLSGNHAIGNHTGNGNGNLLWYDLFDPQLTDNGSGALTLVKTGAGLWVLDNPNNTYSGGTIINGGTLQSQAPGSLGSGPITITSSGTLVLNVGGYTYSNGDQEYLTGDLNSFFSSINSTGTLQAGATIMFDPTDLPGTSGLAPAGYSATGTVSYNSAITLNNVNLGRTSNTGNQTNFADLVLGGNLSLGSGGFVINGNGTTSYTELVGNNTFTGAIVLNGGTSSAFLDTALVIGSANALGTASGSGASKIIVESTSAIAVDPSQISNLSTTPYVVNAPIYFQLGPGGGVGGTVQLQIGTTLLGASSTALSNAITFTGTIVGSNPITGDAGVGFILNNSGTSTTTFSGPIYINDGTQSAANSIEDFDVQAGGGGDIKITGNIADAAPSSLGGGQGGIGYLGSIGQSNGTVTLLGNNTYTGPTSVFRGILQGAVFGNYGTATASSFGSPTTAATGVLGIFSGAEIQDIGTTSDTSNRSVSLIISGNGQGVLDYSGSGTLNLTGGVSSAVTATAGTHTVTLQGTPTGSGLGEISGVISDTPSTATLTTYLAQGSGSTTLTVLNAQSLVGAGSTITISGTNVTGTISAVTNNTITLGTATTGTVTAGETLTVTGGAAAPTSVLKQGTGTWELANVANTYTGVTTINAGTLQVMKLANEGATGGTASSIGASSNAATNLVVNGGTLQYIGTGDSTDRNFQIGTSGATIDASGTGSLVLTGTASYTTANSIRALTLTGTNTGLNTLSSVLVDNGNSALSLTKNGVGTWVLGGANIYSGATTINGGVLSVSSLSNAGNTFSMVSTAGSSTITLASGYTTGSLTVGQSITGNANIPDGDTVASIIDSTHFTISSSTGVTAGTVTTTAGTASGLGIATSGAGNLVINGGTLQYTGVATSTNRNMSIGVNGATLDASGTGAVNFTGGFTITGSATPRTLTLTGTNTGTNTLAGVLADDTGTVTMQTSLLKTGAGTWYLNGANTFTGSVTIANGVLGINTVAALGSAQSLGKGTGTVTLGSAGLSSGTLLFTGTTGTLNQSVTAVGNGGDTIQNGGSGLLTIGGSVAKNGTTLTFTGGTGGIKVTGVISGSSANSDLDITSGTTTLANVDTYNGPTWIYGGGTLSTATVNALPSGTSVNIGTPGSGGVATGSTTTAGTFDIDGNNQTVAGLNTEGTGPTYTSDVVTNNGSGTGTATLTVTGGGNFAGVIQNGTTAKTALSVTGGVMALSGSNTYTGGTSVTSGGTVLASNTATGGSATGNGALSVTGNGSTIGGYGRSSSTTFNIAGTGTATGSRANILVGMNSAGDTNTTQVLTLLGASTSTITNANLTFNLSATTAGALGSNPTGSGTELAVGGTSVSFGTNVASVSLTLNVQNEPAVISAFTPYVLIAGTGVTSDTSGVSGGQYTGLTLGTVTNISPGVTETLITGNNLQIAFSSATDQTWYQAHSYLVLYQDSLNGIDDIDVVVVPEPGTWALMLGGLGLLVFWQRRKNSQR